MFERSEPKRINEFLYAYWDSLRGTRPYPQASEIRKEALRPIWDSCFLVRIDRARNSHGYTYTYLGKSLIALVGNESSEKDIREKLVPPSNLSLVRKFDEVLESGRPVEETSEFTTTRKVRIKYRANLLPLADEEGHIGFILGSMRWKADADRR